MSHQAKSGSAQPPPMVSEVKYSLPQLLAELEAERAAGSFAMEKLDQTEIRKMFKTRNTSRRAKRKD
jgi:hypothetical protein